MRRAIPFLAIIFLATSCTVTTQLYDWKNYDHAVYAYTKKSDEKSVEALMGIYAKLIENSGGSRNVPPPSVCADYGFLLINEGKIEEGKALLLKESELYPESKKFIDLVIKRLER